MVAVILNCMEKLSENRSMLMSVRAALDETDSHAWQNVEDLCIFTKK